jgi:hypothetical protein
VVVKWLEIFTGHAVDNLPAAIGQRIPSWLVVFNPWMCRRYNLRFNASFL